jgi:radical SAM/Cys-rich protein
MTSLTVLGDSFAERLTRDGQTLDRRALAVLQINVGKLCNQTCTHCHVDAGPHRNEIMTRETADRVLSWLATTEISTVDITGGAPELNPSFRHLVATCRAQGRGVIDRCNLTVLFEPGQEGLAEFLKAHQVELACSLPCYLEENVDKQRGSGVFRKSIDALAKLNALGYGRPDSGLVLDLVYNPVGASLPGPQRELEDAYKQHLRSKYGIVFNRLWTITNMPISRFAHYLRHTAQAESYQHRLEAAHNPDNVAQVMCRSTLSVDWQGRIYDCDFNQMLDWPIGNGQWLHVWDVDPSRLAAFGIRTGAHCFGCTAGAGSSCSGALT